MDWNISNRVPLLMAPLRVWMDDGSVRSVRHERTLMGFTLHFTDCCHPLQNVICPSEQVQAWSLATPPGDA